RCLPRIFRKRNPVREPLTDAEGLENVMSTAGARLGARAIESSVAGPQLNSAFPMGPCATGNILDTQDTARAAQKSRYSQVIEAKKTTAQVPAQINEKK
ncbi:hypothetical protein IWW46_005831, partial [Coemansia sp. RSA 2440]